MAFGGAQNQALEKKYNGNIGSLWVREMSKGGLNFRRIHGFNLALLGKKAWCFLTNLESLVARVYKAKHFPSTNVLAASIDQNPNFIWRSITTVIHLVSLGCIWRVGNGRSISVWSEPWLSNKYHPFTTFEIPIGLVSLKVCDMLIPQFLRWS